MEGEIVLSSKRKWLWIGIMLLIFTPPLPVFLFGLALLIAEQKYRKEAFVIIVVSIVLFAIYFVGISSFLQQRGYLQNPVPAEITVQKN